MLTVGGPMGELKIISCTAAGGWEGIRLAFCFRPKMPGERCRGKQNPGRSESRKKGKTKTDAINVRGLKREVLNS